MEVYESAPATPAATGPGMAVMPAMSPHGGQAKKPEEFKTSATMPGVDKHGAGSENDLIETAEAQQVDYVIFFDVSVRASGKNITNNTKFRVMTLDKAKLPEAAGGDDANAREIFSSKLINNQRVEAARDGKKED